MRRCSVAVVAALGVVVGGLANGTPALAGTPGSGAGTLASGAGTLASGSGTLASGSQTRAWTGSWEAGVARDATESFPDTSIRDVVHLSLGGTSVRVRLSNEFGTAPLVFGHVTVAVQDPATASPAAVPGTMRQALFDGRRSVTAMAGGDVVSDPIRLAVPDKTNLLVTVYLPATAATAGPATYHAFADQTSFLSPGGDVAADPAGASFTTQTSSWYYLNGVDVVDPGARGSVVTFGDSITDGVGSTYGANLRWPDVLAARLLAAPTARHLGVQNAGISGNRLLLDGSVDAFGPNALSRLDEDVFSRSSVRTMIVMEGINDIQQSPHQMDPTVIEAALTTIAHRAHAHGIRIIGATLTPFEGWRVYDASLEAVRLAVNNFIRTSGIFDSIADFDLVVRDPADPHQILAAYDSGDHLHPGDAGYQAMADSINLRRL